MQLLCGRHLRRALLRRQRLARGLTQQELADRARLSERSISDLERGVKSAPRLTTVRLLIEVLDLEGADAAALREAVPPGIPARVPYSRFRTRRALHELGIRNPAYGSRQRRRCDNSPRSRVYGIATWYWRGSTCIRSNAAGRVRCASLRYSCTTERASRFGRTDGLDPRNHVIAGVFLPSGQHASEQSALRVLAHREA